MFMQLLRAINGPTPQTALVLIIQDDGSLDNPGQLILDDFSKPALESKKIFYNSDSIYDIWVSATGDIWACSSYGNIYTTADVKFPESPFMPRYDLDSDIIRNSGYSWKMYCLGDAQNGVSIWSPDGVHVFVGTYSGHVYLWDGNTWARQETPTSEKGEKYITQFAGSSVNDVYAIGTNARELLHYDGKNWSLTAYDEKKQGRMAANGIVQQPDGACYLACDGGQVWKTRDGQHFELVAEDPALHFSSLAYAHDQIILAAGENGVYAIQNGQLVNIKNTFPAVMVAGKGTQAVFIRPATEDQDKVTVRYAVYAASDTKPWFGFSFSYNKD